MRVKRLEIAGFKSFADATVLDFSKDLSAVVGPNGCGKSNVVDAMRWALGEQSVRNLRGKNMEDVIFNGSDRRQPTNMAEVSIVFENQGSITSPFYADLSEIMITRRLFRNGDSEYLINKHNCRLKDIQQLLMDTGLSNRAYAIIEQDKVAAFTQAKPEIRRLWLEEAAGITRLKSQKKVSQGKVDEAQLNLKIVDNSLADLAKQMQHLARQSKKAVVYQELRGKIQALDLRVASAEYTAQKQKLSQQEAELVENQHQSLALEQNLTALSLQEEALRIKMLELEQELSQVGTARQENRDKITGLEAELKNAAVRAADKQAEVARYEAERGQIEARREEQEQSWQEARHLLENAESLQQAAREHSHAVAEELFHHKQQAGQWQAKLDAAKGALSDSLLKESQARNRLADVEDKLAALNRQQNHLSSRQRMLEEELLALAAKLKSNEASMAGAKAALRQSEEAIDALAGSKDEEARALVALRRQEGDLSRRYQQLTAEFDARETSLASYDWAQGAVRGLIKEKGALPFEILGVVAEKLNVAPGAETLVEAALAADLQAVIVQDQAQADALFNWLRERKLGRLRVVVLAMLQSQNLTPPAGFSPLSGLVTAEPGFEALACLWAGAAQAQEELWAAGSGLQPGQVLVGSEGQRLDKPGAASLGQGNMGALLSKRNQLKELALAVEQALAAWQEGRALREQAEKNLEELESDIQFERDQQREAEQKFRQQERELQISQASLKQKERELETIGFEQDEKTAEQDRLERETVKLNEELLTQAAKRERAESNLAEASSRLETMLAALEEIQQKDISAKLELNNLQNRLNNARELASRLGREVDDAKQKLAGLTEATQAAQALLNEISERQHTGKDALEQYYRLSENHESAFQGLRQRQEEVLAQEYQFNENKKQMEARQRALQQTAGNLELQVSKLSLALDAICQQIEERCQLNLLDELAGYTPEDGFDLQAAKEELNRLRLQLNRLGPVNLEAISDYENLSTKHKELTEQKADVENALQDMRKAVRDINQRSRGLFMATLQEVNEKLAQVFPSLFVGGGKASLVLVDDSDPLEAGLDILVELPGKKVKNLEAMSGGEKALIAVAVLFALFLIRPAPFCILDEVDAPLDEANVDRFHILLRQLSQQSQILLITHNRRTMEAMEMLYGVTMQEKGVSKILAVMLGENGVQPEEPKAKSLVVAA